MLSAPRSSRDDRLGLHFLFVHTQRIHQHGFNLVVDLFTRHSIRPLSLVIGHSSKAFGQQLSRMTND